MHLNYKRFCVSSFSFSLTNLLFQIKILKVLFLSMKVAFDLRWIEFITNLQTRRFGYDGYTIEFIKINISGQDF